MSLYLPYLKGLELNQLYASRIEKSNEQGSSSDAFEAHKRRE